MVRHIRLLKIRALLSLSIFAAFVITGGIFAVQSLSEQSPTPLVVLLLSGYFLLPRRTLPRGYKPQSGDDEAYVEILDEWRKKFVKLRLVYFVLAIVVLLILPAVF